MSEPSDQFPPLEPAAINATRDALHDYAKVLGAWAVACRKKRKHWWHGSLRPSLYGLSTGVIYGAVNFELTLNLVSSELQIFTATKEVRAPLVGQSSAQLAETIRSVLVPMGMDEEFRPAKDKQSDDPHPDYSPEQANTLHRAIASVVPALEDFRAGIREETSPIQLWPHHFDLSMIWLPGPKIEGEDVNDEESADKQMNFGFTLGDAGIAEPYFYVTAYPLSDGLPNLALPEKTRWQSDGFSGAVTLYKDVAALHEPQDYLRGLWRQLIEAAKAELA